MVLREAERLELRLVPAGPKAQNEPAAADLVDRGGLFGKQRRVMEIRTSDQGTQLDPRGRGGDGGQRRPGLPWPSGRAVRPAIEQMLADPHGVETEVLDRADHVEQFRPADLALDLGELDADLERSASRGGHGPKGRSSVGRPCREGAGGAAGRVGRVGRSSRLRKRKRGPVRRRATFTFDKKRGPVRRRGHVLRSGGAHLCGAWALGARLDIELNPLAADQAIEVE